MIELNIAAKTHHTENSAITNNDGISSLRCVARNDATLKTDNPVPAMKLAVAEKHLRCRSAARGEMAGHNQPFLNPARRSPATT